MEYERVHPPYSADLAEWVLEAVGGKRPSLALDVGCGTGRSTRWARSFCDQVVGIDKSPEALAIARALNEDSRVSFQLGVAENLDVHRIATIDMVLVGGGAFEWFDKTRFTSAVRRVLSGGKSIGLVWIWLEPLDEVSSRWYWIMRQLLGAQVGPEANDSQAMAMTCFPQSRSWKVVRSYHKYGASELHQYLRAFSYWRPRASRVAESELLIDGFLREAADADGTVRLAFREVGFVGRLAD